MVYRVHFTAQDLTRTRLADSPHPLSELMLAARLLQERSQPVRMNAWRRHALAQLTDSARRVLSLVPPIGWSPTFLLPGLAGSAEEVIEAARSSSPRLVKEEMAAIAEHQPMPGWARHLADDAELRRQVFDAVAGLYGSLLAPYWERLTPRYTADRSLRTRQFLTGGVEHLLTQANPRWMTWNPPVLEIRMPNRVEFDLHLEGQGVLLVPSLWSTRTIVRTMVDDDHPQPIITYPAGHDEPLSWLTALVPGPVDAGPSEAVRKLLGRTRAEVLDAIAEHPGCTTTELAKATRISVASASEHATVLRQAGLIRTLRHRNTALHTPTPLGQALLNGQPPAN